MSERAQRVLDVVEWGWDWLDALPPAARANAEGLIEQGLLQTARDLAVYRTGYVDGRKHRAEGLPAREPPNREAKRRAAKSAKQARKRNRWAT